jgi:hypothetical protein
MYLSLTLNLIKKKIVATILIFIRIGITNTSNRTELL